MITAVRTMTINQIAERKDDLLVSADDIKELAKNERAKALDEFAERLKNYLNEFDFWKYGITDGKNYQSRNYDYMIDEVAEQLKGGAVDG